MDMTRTAFNTTAKLALVAGSLALTTNASAQDLRGSRDFRHRDPNATVRVVDHGIVITPSSSHPGAAGRVHTNVHILKPDVIASGVIVGSLVGTPPQAGYFFETPASIACIYHLTTAVPGCNPNVATATATGGSRVIAIVDAYNAPNLMADLTTFSAQFGLPAPTTASFQVVYAASDGTQTTTAPAYDPGWELEQSLDAEWAHAMAPNAKIIVVEAASSSDSDLLAAEWLAGQLAAAAGGGQVSNSWGEPEFDGEAQYDAYFQASGVVYFASTGDTPGTQWPAVSTNVVAVGGTSVSRNPVTGTFQGETTWDSGGGGPSSYVPRPLYQNPVGTVIGGTMRGIPDVAAVANPITGVWMYDSNAGGWMVVGGTSVAAPVVAGITNSVGRFSLSSNAELTRIYASPSLSNDVNTGVCGPYVGYWAAAGWDFCTGNGSPAGNGLL